MRAKAAALAEATEYLSGLLAPGLDPETIAAWCLQHSQGPDDGTGQWHLEVPSRWTKDGHPLPFYVSLQRFRVENTRSAVILWEGVADDEQDALDASADAAGYRDFAHACEVAPVRDGEIIVSRLS